MRDALWFARRHLPLAHEKPPQGLQADCGPPAFAMCFAMLPHMRKNCSVTPACSVRRRAI